MYHYLISAPFSEPAEEFRGEMIIATEVQLAAMDNEVNALESHTTDSLVPHVNKVV